MEINGEIAAVVTGGASGLGEAVVRSLAAKGARVALFDRDADRGTKLAGECGGLFVPVDVGDPKSVRDGLAARGGVCACTSVPAGSERSLGPAFLG